jgi:alkylhydroperoxidase family enzyme
MARISFKLPHDIEDPECRDWLETAIADGKPGPEFQAIRAHVPGVMRSFTESRRWIYHEGVLEFELKELVRAYIALSGDCAYCSNQGVARQINADDGQRAALLAYHTSDAYTPRQQLAFRFADVIMWSPELADDELWAQLHGEFSEAEIVELGYWIGFTFGGQRFLKTLASSQGQLQTAMEAAGAEAEVRDHSVVSD